MSQDPPGPHPQTLRKASPQGTCTPTPETRQNKARSEGWVGPVGEAGGRGPFRERSAVITGWVHRESVPPLWAANVHLLRAGPAGWSYPHRPVSRGKWRHSLILTTFSPGGANQAAPDGPTGQRVPGVTRSLPHPTPTRPAASGQGQRSGLALGKVSLHPAGVCEHPTW